VWSGGSWISIGDFRMEDFMLEDYYVKPSTVDRVRQAKLPGFQRFKRDCEILCH